MRSLLLLILVGILSLSFSQKSRDGIDPNPTAPAYNAGSKTEKKQPEKPPLPPVIDETHIVRKLSGYPVGQPTHMNALSFCRDVGQQIRTLEATGRVIERVLVTGYADGIPNKGLMFHLLGFPTTCQRGVSLPIDDRKLAMLRGCIILQQLSDVIGSSHASGVAWEHGQFDEPDGGNQGDDFRKVTVDVFLRRTK